MPSDRSVERGTERELRVSEQRFRVMANAVPLLEWAADADGNFTWFNDRWYDYTGSTFDEMKGDGWRKAHHRDEVDRVVLGIRRAFSEGAPWDDLFRLRSRTGEYRWFLARAVPVTDEDDRVVQWFGALTDATDRREAERERERLLDQERSAHAEAVEAVRARDHVLSIVSHDLRNPLGTITMSASLLLDLVPDVEERRAERRQLEIIARAAANMNRMIQDLLDATRIEAGRLTIDRAPTDAKTVLDETMALQRPLADAAGIALECRLAEELPLMCADAQRVGQILGNLVGNALKFTTRGGTITISAEAAERAVLWRVSDTGKGIPADQLPHLFDRFWQSRRGDRRGLGLGLSIVDGLVKAHGGRIDVASETGKGTTVGFTIPDVSAGCDVRAG
jgi:PAS domain S-box-containing protein